MALVAGEVEHYGPAMRRRGGPPDWIFRPVEVGGGDELLFLTREDAEDLLHAMVMDGYLGNPRLERLYERLEIHAGLVGEGACA